jgi:hypothetical protein
MENSGRGDIAWCDFFMCVKSAGDSRCHALTKPQVYASWCDILTLLTWRLERHDSVTVFVRTVCFRQGKNV